MARYKYFIDDPEDQVSFGSEWGEKHLKWLAEAAAEDYFHDGGYEGWKFGDKRFTVLTETGDVLGTFDVTLEYAPTFWATEAK